MPQFKEINMKYLGLLVFSVMLLSGCDYDDDAIVERAKEIEKNRIAAKNKETLKVLEEHVYEYNKTGIGKRETYNNPNKRISVIEFDGCEYVLYEDNIGTRYGTAGLAHKGNCKRCEDEK